MEPVIYRITLKLNDTTKPSLAMRQGDTARRIYFQLAQDGKPYAITPGCYAVLSGVKPDGTTLFNNCVIDGNTIIYDTTDQTTAVKGRVKCELTLYDEQEQMVTSPGFDIVVHGKVLPGEGVASSDEANALRKLVSDGLEAINDCNNATEQAGAATVKATNAAAAANTAEQRASDAALDAEDAAKRADKAADDIIAAKDRGEFNGPKGDKGEKGDTGEVNINDDTTSDDSTWSSSRISAQIADCVGYYSQNKSSDEKAQARENIGAIGDGDYVTELTADFLGVADSDDPSAPGSKRAAYMRYWGCRDDGTDMIRLIGTESYTGDVAISGIAPGIEDTDAVNVKQLKDAELRMVDKLCPTFTESGSVVTCEPVEGYPLTVTAEDGATQITRCGKNLFDISKIKATTIPEDQYATASEIAEVGADYIAVRAYPNYTGNGFTHTNVKFRELCPSVRVGDTITLNAITDSVQRIFYLTPAQIPIYFGKAIEVTEAMLDSNIIIYGLDNLNAKQGTGVCIVKNIQVEFGNAATAYEPYRAAETFPPDAQILAIAGTNVLRADVGNITVSGRADLAAEIEKLKNAILAMGAHV